MRLRLFIVLIVLWPGMSWGTELLSSRSITLNASNAIVKSPVVNLDPLTSMVVVKLQRPTTAVPLSWNASGRVRVTLIVTVDGVEYRCEGRTAGGVRVRPIDGTEIPAYELTYKLPVILGQKAREYMQTAEKDQDGFYTDVPLTRLGETGSTITGQVILERIGGNVQTAITLAESQEAPAPTVRTKNSVAYDAATSAQEVAGDGVLSLSHTSSGSDRAVFAGVLITVHPSASTGVTYDGSGMTANHAAVVANSYMSFRTYRAVGQSTGAVTVTSTCSTGGGADEHSLHVVSLTGVDSSTPVGTAVTATGFSPTGPSATVGSLTADGMIVDLIVAYTNTPTVGADQTQRTTQTQGDFTQRTSTQSSNVAGGVMSWGGDPVVWGLSAIEFKPGSGGGPTCRGALLLMGVGGC